MALPVIIVVAAAVVVPAAVLRRQWTLTVGFTTAGTGVALQTPAVYEVVDPLLGGWNATNLIYHLCTVVGIAGFLLLVLTADPTHDARRAFRLVAVCTASACVLEVALFALGVQLMGWGSADAHLSEHVAEPLFLGYASILWIGLAGLAIAAIITQRAQTRGRPWSVGKVGLALVVAGCVVSLCWCANAVAIATTAVLRGRAAPADDPLGQALALIGGGAVFAGLATTNVPHMAARLDALRLGVLTRPLWRRAIAAAPEVALRSGRGPWVGGRATLYRRWVEIEDAVRLERLPLTRWEHARVTELERLFAPAATAGSVPSGKVPR